MGNLTVARTAKLMKKSEQFVRIGLQRGILPFGYAVKTSTKWNYYISPSKFSETTGIEVKDNMQDGYNA